MAQLKFRPVLTEEDILHIITLARNNIASAAPINKSASTLVLGALVVFKAKIEASKVVAAYSSEEPISSEDRKLIALGANSAHGNTTPYASKEEYWKRCYNKMLTHSKATLTGAELDAAHEHMYLNDLFTPEELIEFETNKHTSEYTTEQELDL